MLNQQFNEAINCHKAFNAFLIIHIWCSISLLSLDDLTKDYCIPVLSKPNSIC